MGYKQGQGILWQGNGGRICNMPILRDGLEDRVLWFHANNGIYSTKSAYS